MKLPVQRDKPKYDIRSFTINGKQVSYDAVMQRKLNAIRILKDDDIITEKEYYILRYRILRQANEVPENMAMENDQ